MAVWNALQWETFYFYTLSTFQNLYKYQYFCLSKECECFCHLCRIVQSVCVCLYVFCFLQCVHQPLLTLKFSLPFTRVLLRQVPLSCVRVCVCVCGEILWHPEWWSDRRYDPLRRLLLSDTAVILQSSFLSFFSSEGRGKAFHLSLLFLSLLVYFLLRCLTFFYLPLLFSVSYALLLPLFAVLLFFSFARIFWQNQFRCKKIDTYFSSHFVCILPQKRGGQKALRERRNNFSETKSTNILLLLKYASDL